MSKIYRENLKQALSGKREKLSANSLQTYVSLLMSLSKKLKDVDTVQGLIKSKPVITLAITDMKSMQSQKTLLSALYILTGDVDYRDKMMIYIAETNKKYKEQKVSDKLKDSYISQAKIQEVYDDTKKKVMNVPSVENYVNYLIVALMSGVFIPPRRLEYGFVKIRNFNKKTDNYLESNTIGFNNYKTYKTYGFQMIAIPKEVRAILKKFLKLNETDYLLIKKNGKPFSASELSKRIGTIFNDDKIGVDVLRSIYISNEYKDVPALMKMEDTAKAMGHAVGSAITFYKKNDISK